MRGAAMTPGVVRTVLGVLLGAALLAGFLPGQAPVFLVGCYTGFVVGSWR